MSTDTMSPPEHDEPFPGMPEPAPGGDQVDPDAPLGRTQSGAPRKSRAGRPPGSRSSRRAAPRKSTPGAAKRAATPDYAAAIMGLLQLPAAALAMAGASTGNPELRVALVADAAALTIYGPDIAAALDQLARENAAVAAVLERLLTVGPYGAILAAVVPLCLQLAANHRLVPGGALGTVEPARLVDSIQPQDTAA